MDDDDHAARFSLVKLEIDGSVQNGNEQTGNHDETVEDDGNIQGNDFVANGNEDSSHENEKKDKKLSFKNIPTKKKFLFVCMGLANFGSAACFSVLAPFFPGKAADKGVSATVTGLIFAVHEFMIFVTSPIFGSFLVKIGAKRTFAIGILVCGFCSVIFGLLDRAPDGAAFIVLCFVVQIVEAVGASAFVTASFAIIAYEFPGHEATVFGTLEAFNGLGMMIGPALGGAFYIAGGYGLPFWILGGMLVACGFVSLKLMPTLKDAGRPYSGSLFTLLKSPQVVVIGYSLITTYISIGFLDPTLANHYIKFNLTPFLIGLIFLIAPFIYAAEAPLVGWLGDKKGHTKAVLIFGHSGIILAFLLLGPAPFLPFLPFELWSQIIALIAIGILLGCNIIPSFKSILKGARHLGMPDDFNTFGIVSGYVNSVMSLGSVIGPFAGGIMVEQIKFGWAASVIALLYVISSIVLITFAIVDKYYIRPRRKTIYKSLHHEVQLQEISRNQDGRHREVQLQEISRNRDELNLH